MNSNDEKRMVMQVRFSPKRKDQVKLFNDIEELISKYGIDKAKLMRCALRLWLKQNSQVMNKLLLRED